MNSEAVLALASATFGMAMAFAPLLQAQRMRARGSGADVSVLFLAIIATGAATWAAYGVALGNWALIAPNAVGTMTNLLTMAYAVTLRGRPADAAVVALRSPA